MLQMPFDFFQELLWYLDDKDVLENSTESKERGAMLRKQLSEKVAAHNERIAYGIYKNLPQHSEERQKAWNEYINLRIESGKLDSNGKRFR
jgi:hypothetical protein